MTTETTAPLLSEIEVSEIEARANAASRSYVVDWSKGEHALLQASGWRPANEEQPRTIATFDKEDGYLDLLFCAEARTDIDALIRDWRALKTDLKYRCESLEELRGCRDRWLTMLNPTSPDETVDGAIRNLQQAYTAERDNAVELESQNAALREQLAQVEKELATTKQHRNDLIEELERERKIPNKAPSTRSGFK